MGLDRAISTSKHFTARDPIGRWTCGHAGGRAYARSAKALPYEPGRRAPFEIKGGQVDGGCRSKAACERAGADNGLALGVLALSQPQLDGALDRDQGAWRRALTACFDLPHRVDELQALALQALVLQGVIDAFAHRFNSHRPHRTLGDQTPAEHLKRVSSEPPAPQTC